MWSVSKGDPLPVSTLIYTCQIAVVEPFFWGAFPVFFSPAISFRAALQEMFLELSVNSVPEPNGYTNRDLKGWVM